MLPTAAFQGFGRLIATRGARGPRFIETRARGAREGRFIEHAAEHVEHASSKHAAEHVELLRWAWNYLAR